MEKTVIFSTQHFQVESWDEPHIDRNDGGHLVILPKARVEDRTCLSLEEATELMKLTIVVGAAMTTALKAGGIDIGRINYQDNGNWGVFSKDGPYLHIHLYGRAQSAKIQTFGEALHFPNPNTDFYDTNRPLTDADHRTIVEEISKIRNQWEL